MTDEPTDEREDEYLKIIGRDEGYEHYNKARELQLKINQFNSESEDRHYE